MPSMRPMRVAAELAAPLATLTVVALLAISAGATRAEEAEPEYERSGAYVTGSVTGVIEAFDDSPSSTEDGAWGASASWGYRANPRFGVDLSFTWLDKLDKVEDNSEGVKIVKSASVDIWFLVCNLKYIFPMGRFQPYVRAGGGFIQANFHGIGVDREVGLTTSMGGGTDFYFTEKLALNANVDFILPVGDSVSDLKMGIFTTGLKYRF
jgi:opacity protein-like surface antigen